MREQHLGRLLVPGSAQTAAALASGEGGLGLLALGAASGLVLLEGLFDALFVLGLLALFLLDLVLELLVLFVGQLALGAGQDLAGGAAV